MEEKRKEKQDGGPAEGKSPGPLFLYFPKVLQVKGEIPALPLCQAVLLYLN